MPRTAIIVGAGIGGLSAGIALRKAGWNIRVFERAASPRELGFGLLIAPNAFAALRELGIADIVRSRAFEGELAELRRMDGTVVKRVVVPRGILGGPLLVALRPALHGALLEAVGMDAIVLSSEVMSHAVRHGRPTVTLASGAEAEGDLLVAADGMGSRIRAALHPNEPPARTSNIIAIRGGVHGAVQHLGDLSGIYYLGPGLEAFIVRASDTGIYWALSLAREVMPSGSWEPRAVVAQMAPQMDDTFRAVTSMTSDLRIDELYDRDPLPFWGSGVVTLLGDAAHPLLPHTGQGAAQAMVDAVTLGRLVHNVSDLEPALRAYENERRLKTAILVAKGRRYARFSRIISPTACSLREWFVRALPVTTAARLFASISRRAGTDIPS